MDVEQVNIQNHLLIADLRRPIAIHLFAYTILLEVPSFKSLILKRLEWPLCPNTQGYIFSN